MNHNYHIKRCIFKIFEWNNVSDDNKPPPSVKYYLSTHVHVFVYCEGENVIHFNNVYPNTHDTDIQYT